MDASLNVMTEEDASKKYCCGKVQPNCVGSNCMAWRWQPMMQAEYDLPASPYLGFCGLAGE